MFINIFSYSNAIEKQFFAAPPDLLGGAFFILAFYVWYSFGSLAHILNLCTL